jgi:hypothetical protein
MLKLKSFQNRELLTSFESIKVKPSTTLLAFGGVLLFAYLVVGASYMKERQEQLGLTEQIQAGGGTLSGTGDSQQSLRDLRTA